VRSAAYQAATLEERQSVHRALAEATDHRLDPDRRAWHRAEAAAGLDEEVAEELEHSASRAQARGGLAAAAAFLERATALTLEPARRAQRALAAAQATHQAGAPDTALRLLATAQAGPLDELQRARVDLLRGQIVFASRRGGDAPPLLLKAAERLESLDVGLARDTHLEAFAAAIFAGRLVGDSGGGVPEVAEAARAAPRLSRPPRAPDLLLDGLALLVTEGYAAGAPSLKRALSAFRSGDISDEEGLRWLWLAGRSAMALWDDETWYVLTTRHVQLAREVGALAVLPVALSSRVTLHLYAGELSQAAALIEEVEAITEATGSHIAPYGALALAALEGHEAKATRLSEAIVEEVVSRGEGVGLAVTDSATALLCNGVGRYGQALAAAQEASKHPEELWSTWALPELIEAAARSGMPERASDALERLAETTRAAGTDWALGIEARSRALLNESDPVDGLYDEAIERLSRARVRVALARTHLLYGEWLRRRRRRVDAREQLRTAHELFTAMGIAGFAQRAARELLATGETARKRTVETAGDLTAQEAQIARLARDGLSNPEIGARLFISPRTVEYHLHKVFNKLDIGARSQLALVLPSDSTPPEAASG
jgi:DNA-binding CsgD family transcriptional regulator